MTVAADASGPASRVPRKLARGIRPRRVKGRWRTVKTVVLSAVAGTLYLLPWLRWSREAGRPQQAVLFDFASARAYVFGFEFGPQDLFLLLALLIAAAFALFLTNTLVGRIWCGFSCPQTLWTDLFVMIERWIEGERQDRIRRQSNLQNGRDWLRKPAKHGLWLAISSATGLTVVSYFVDARVLWPGFLAGSASAGAATFVLVFTAATYLLAGFAREVVCTHMCPWPRFQAAMLDSETLIVSYRSERGEPRGPLKRVRTQPDGHGGDCVDCGLCVAVCPTGIDIRDGMQLACIGCGLCADACNGVMKKLDRPLGLISFVSEREMASPDAGLTAGVRRFRIRPVAFAALLAITSGLIVWSLLERTTIDVAITHDRAPPYVTLSDGSIRNIFTLRVADRRVERTRLRVTVDHLAGAVVQVSRSAEQGAHADELGFEGTSFGEATFRLMVSAPSSVAPVGRRDLTFHVVDTGSGAVVATVVSYFWGPESGTHLP